jgi:hypothetical protein
MPNGGTHHCRRCIHFRDMHCTLRKVKIDVPYWTTCRDFRQEVTVPTGPVYAIVCEVKSGKGHYTDIPYFKGRRAETHQEGGGDTSVRFVDEKGDLKEFRDVEAYLRYWEEKNE